MSYFRSDRFGVSRDAVIDLVTYSVIGAFVGGKLLAWINLLPWLGENWDRIIWSWVTISSLIRAGFVFYGGLDGMILAFYIYCRRHGEDFGAVMELVAPAIPLFHAFGRFGCFTAGCCYGVGGFPLQLVSVGLNAVIFFIIIILQNRGLMQGRTIYLYFLLYSFCRFIIEFFRGDMGRGFIGPLSISQWISIFLFAFAAFRFVSQKTRKNICNNY